MESILEKGKTCSKCGKYKALDFFSRDGRGGFRNDCKECAAKQQHYIRKKMQHATPEPYKRCARDGRWLPISMFAKDPTKKDGHRSQCKECDAEARRWKNRNKLLKNPASNL